MHFTSKMNTWKVATAWITKKHTELNHNKKAFQMSILNEEMRAERTQHRSLESQVHRQNKGWIEGVPVIFLSFVLKTPWNRAITTRKEILPAKTKKTFSLFFFRFTFFLIYLFWLEDIFWDNFDTLLELLASRLVSSITALYCPCSTITFQLTIYYYFLCK